MRTKLTINRTSFCSTRSCLSYWVENHPTNPVNTRIRTTWFWSIHLLILAEWICRARDSDPIVSTCWWYIRSCQRHTIQDIAGYTEWHWRCVCWNKFLAVFSEKLRAKIKSEFRCWSYRILIIETHLYLCMEYIVLHKNFSLYECRLYNQYLKASDHQHHYNWRMKLVHLLQRSIEGNHQELKFKSSWIYHSWLKQILLF